MTFKWAKVVGKATAIRIKCGDLLTRIQRLKLSWINIPPGFGGDFGGWVSENYGGTARILPWVYSVLPSIKNSVDFVEPTKPVDKWIMKETQEWLSIRGLSKAGNAQKLKDTVNQWKRLPLSQQPPIKKYLQATTLEVLQFMHAWTRVYSLLMVGEIVDQEYYSSLLKRIMLFLSMLDKVDQGFRVDESSVPRWISTYNWICLMNLPEMVRMFGPIRLLWEGGWKGEGFVRLIKPLITNGFHKNWQSVTLTHLLQNMAMDELTEKIPLGHTNIMKEKHAKMYVCYKNVSNCITEVGRSEAISVVMRRDTYFPMTYMVYRSGNDRYLLPIKRIDTSDNPEAQIEFLGMYYHKYELMPSEDGDEELGQDVLFDDYGIMLPIQDPNITSINRRQLYTIVTKEYSEQYMASSVIA